MRLFFIYILFCVQQHLACDHDRHHDDFATHNSGAESEIGLLLMFLSRTVLLRSRPCMSKRNVVCLSLFKYLYLPLAIYSLIFTILYQNV